MCALQPKQVVDDPLDVGSVMSSVQLRNCKIEVLAAERSIRILHWQVDDM